MSAPWASLTGLDMLMARTEGDPSIRVGLVDGAVALDHPALRAGAVRSVAGAPPSHHGTAVAGVLAAERDSGAPAVCPGCSVVVVPLLDARSAVGPRDLARAILVCLAEGATLINVSAAFVGSLPDDRALRDALDTVAERGALVVAAAGNGGRIGGSPLAGHPVVVTVASCTGSGGPLATSNLGASIGQRGVLAPGDPVPSLAPGGGLAPLGGTSLAAALVTGALALAWSLAPGRSVQQLRAGLAGPRSTRRSIVPPLLDATALLPRDALVVA